MSEFAQEVLPVSIEDELQQSYLDYAMSVIVGRALPEARDGLKPVHRRVLFAMNELHNDYNKPYKKSARVVGDVIGKYHPHGDAAVYETIVRMAQPFSLRYMLVDGQGNFGSIDGDSAAAMRYTEVRLQKIAHELLDDLDKETVDFVPNYDGTEFTPVVLPTKIPNLLVNGSTGIAVGMATNIPPHNLGEVVDACLALIDEPNLSIQDLMQYIPGPDFPTAAIINGCAGILRAYKTGQGKIYIKARAEIETQKSGKQAIVVTELPYQVNKARLQEKIGELVKDRRVEGITAIRDESDKKGMRVVVEVRKGENAEVILNNLYRHTQLQVSFGINMVALDGGQPKLMSLLDLLNAFIRHRREVVTRRTIFELKKKRDREGILEGLGVALVNIDEVVVLIKAAKTPKEAKLKLMAREWSLGTMQPLLERAGGGTIAESYKLSETQAQAILDMRLHRLTGLEQDKIVDEYEKIIQEIAKLQEILEEPEILLNVIRTELQEIKEKYNDARRTEIVAVMEDMTNEDLIAEEEVVVTVSHQGYAKAQSLDDYQTQRRGGRGKTATRVKEEDFVEHLVMANTHDTVLCFSNKGKVYWLKAYMLPQGGRLMRGKPIVNLLPLEKDERLNAILPVKSFSDDSYVMMATANGVVKKLALSNFARPRSNGIIALDLVEDDYLVGVALTNGQQKIMLFSNAGKVNMFHEDDVRPMGRTARGVRGIKLLPGQKVVSLVVNEEDGAILTATEHGYGKRTLLSDYPLTRRAGSGVIAIQIGDRNGQVVGAIYVKPSDDIMLISDKGVLVRTRVNEVSVIGRNTQGVKLINLGGGEKLIAVQKIVEMDDEGDAE